MFLVLLFIFVKEADEGGLKGWEAVGAGCTVPLFFLVFMGGVMFLIWALGL